MEKVVISLLKGKRWKLIGLSIRNEESIEDLQKMVKVVKESLQKNFPSTPIVGRKAVRELFGEYK